MLLTTTQVQHREETQQLQANIAQLQKCKVDLQCEVSTLLRQRNARSEDYERFYAQRGHIPAGATNFSVNDLAWRGIVSRVLVK